MRTAALGILLAATGAAFAQSTASFSKTESGEVVVSKGGRVDRLRSVAVQVYRDGRFRISVDNRYEFQLSGAYRQSTTRTFRLTIDSALGDSRGRGNGTLELGPDDRIAMIRAEGTADGERFEFQFVRQRVISGQEPGRPNRPGWGGGGQDWDDQPGWGDDGRRPDSQSVSGTGTMDFDGDRDRLSSVRVSYRSRDEFVLEFSGGARLRVEGDYRKQGNNDRLSVRQINNERASGSGTIRRDSRGRIASVELDARYRSRRLDVDFRSGSGGWQGGGSDSGGWQGGGGSHNSETGTFNARGTGRMEYRNDDDRLSGATLALRSGSRFELRFSGEARATIEGSWRREGGNNVRMTITRINGQTASGSGLVRRDARDQISLISLEARYKGDRLRIDFDTRD